MTARCFLEVVVLVRTRAVTPGKLHGGSHGGLPRDSNYVMPIRTCIPKGTRPFHPFETGFVDFDPGVRAIKVTTFVELRIGFFNRGMIELTFVSPQTFTRSPCKAFITSASGASSL